MHPALSPLIERAAYCGGCDGVSTLEAARLTGTDPSGTMPHGLVLCMGSTAKAFRAYDASLPPSAPRVALVDTYQDERVEAVALAEAFGTTLDALRFDTPASRRGDFPALLAECRWELDLRGHRHIRFIVSGGLQERDLLPVADAFGVGSAISNAPVVDLSMDIVEVDGIPAAKRGKRSGSKALLACPACGARRVASAAKPPGPCPCGGTYADLLAGVSGPPAEAPAAVRERVLRALEGRTVTPLPDPA
jgi:nicotinate phosphoribosyltransferase